MNIKINIMNTFIKLIAYFLKVVNLIVFTLPMKLKLITVAYSFGIMYLLLGTTSMTDLGNGPQAISWVGQAAVFIFLGLPSLVGVFTWLSEGEDPKVNTIDGHLNSVISHRNNMMNHSSAKEAHQIMKKTAHLDMMKTGGYSNAVMGFNATSGKNSPSKVYEELVDK